MADMYPHGSRLLGLVSHPDDGPHLGNRALVGLKSTSDLGQVRWWCSSTRGPRPHCASNRRTRTLGAPPPKASRSRG